MADLRPHRDPRADAPARHPHRETRCGVQDGSVKLSAVVDRVCEVHQTGQPVLVGTRSVLTSEEIGRMLNERG